MKKTIVSLCLVVCIIAACGPRAAKTPAPPEVAATTETTVLAGNAKAGGLLISSAKCTKCHGDKSGHVPKHTFAEQEKLMLAMAKKARLTPEETADLMEYVKTSAKKS